MKHTVSLILVLCMLFFALVSCGSSHEHEFRGWVTIKDATLTETGVKERTCVCGEKETAEIPAKFDELSDFMKNNASDYSKGSYTVRENAKTFGKDCSLVYPGYGVEEGGWSIALTFNPSTKETIFLISYGYVTSMLKTLAFTVQDGVIVNRYDYIFQSENFTGGYKDQIYGSIYPSSLIKSETLDYTSYSAGSGKAFSYFVDGYQKDACAYVKQLVTFFNAYFKSVGLSLTMRDFGFWRS